MTKIYFQTHGCSTNISESEIMMGLLKEADFCFVTQPADSEIIIVNICTVKGEETAIRIIRKLIEENESKKLIVAGCITKIILKEIRSLKEECSFINTHNIKSIVDVVEEVINDNIVGALGSDNYKKINLPKVRKSDIVGVIPILNGCANYCSYCSVRYVKGKLMSYAIQDIKNEAVRCIANGCKELWITSQDNAAYMLENSETSKLPYLINEIVKIEGDYKIRIGMMNPKHLQKILPDMVNVFKHSKIYKFLHVPVQSGNDEILKLMKRNYEVSDFKKIISKFRDEIPNITISTDIITGFPTETEEQFNDSLNLIKEIKPNVLNISRFQPRPGTEASKMDGQINGRITKERSRIITDVFLNIARMNNERWLGWEGDILINEIGKLGTSIGRNSYYKPVILQGEFRMGDVVKAKIHNVSSYDLRAELI
ncbi:MAG: tRNA (N(6)-L-threonylcarbamoyladenosine(37)-C(2))-methylthiotransferase [Nanoarchaeota archaeon]